MATGKARNTKRSPGAFSPTTTILIFVALSGLALWLFTSHSFGPFETMTTSRKSGPIQVTSIAQPDHGHSKPSVSEIHQGHEDIPAILPDEPTVNAVDFNAKADEAAGTSDQMHNNKNNNNINNDGVKQETKPAAMDNVDVKSGDVQGQSGKDTVEEQEKQAALETQTSEESVVTQKQEVEQVKDEIKANHPVKKDNDVKQGSVEKGSETVPQNNQITEEERRKRIADHQKKDDDQVQPAEQQKKKEDPQGAMSDDQVQHDEDGQINNAQLPASLPNGDITAMPKESNESRKSWSTQADQSVNQKERRKVDKDGGLKGHKWKLCNETAGADYIPCLDNEVAIEKIHKRDRYQHRERHCPEEAPTCLVPMPKGYKKPTKWPQSRDKIWYRNVPHLSLADYKGHQNWVKRTGEYLIFPGGGTQFIHGALHYIDFIQQSVGDIAWGKHSRVVLDVGCGVASFGGFLFERDVLTMSFAPKDEHEAQVQFALERGIPAISAVMGSKRLPYPSRVFDVVHCARCRVPWHADGGSLLLELNRLIRPGGYFVWSATPVYQTLEEDVQIWKEMSNLTMAMCWDLIAINNDTLNQVGIAIYQKPDSNSCYEKRKQKEPPMCKDDDDPNAAWYVPLQSCLHRVPDKEDERGSQWPEEWPKRLMATPYWLNKSQVGIYGKPAPEDFTADNNHWQKVVNRTYLTRLGINWSEVRNVMDMRAVYGGFAAALKDMKVWVMNVVNVDSADTLPIIYERGLFGMYHDWCESFSTYPRSYDLLHADHLLSKLKKRCNLVMVMAEIDRIVRPGGKLVIRDELGTIKQTEKLLKSLHWEVKQKFTKNQDGILSAQKTHWRPSH